MLETQVVPVPFSGGVDTKTDQKMVLPGKLTLLENGVFITAEKVRKRYGGTILGQKILGSTSTISSGQAVSVLGNELTCLSSNTLYSYSPELDQWISKGSLYSAQVRNEQVIRNSAQQTVPDLAILNGVALYAWKDSRGGVRATVSDIDTGAQFQSDVEVSSSGTLPRCVVVGNYLFVVYGDSTSLKCKRLDPRAPQSFGSELTLETNLNSGTPFFDAVTHGRKCVIAYHSGTSIKVFYLTQDGVVGSTSIGLPNLITITENATNCLSVVVEPTTLEIYIFCHNGTNGTRYAVLYPDFSGKVAMTTIEATTAPTTLRITGYQASTSSVRVFYEVNATNSYDHFVKTCTVTNAGVVSTPTVLKRSVGLASKAFIVGSDIFVNVAFDSTLQATYFSVKSDGTIMAKMLATRAGGLPADRVLPSVVHLSDDEVAFPAQIKTKFISEGNTTYTLKGVSLSRLTFNWTNQFASRQLGDNDHFVGGFLSMYDGQAVVEHGFHLFPENVTATPATSGGSMADGIYQYYVVYEWVDNRGQVHRSSPSVGLSATVSGGSGSGKVTLSIPTLRMTAKTGSRTNVVLSVYRTKSSGTIAYKITSISSPTYNDPTADTVSYQDTQADSAIGANEILYTTGGVIENIAAPSCTLIDVYQNRMVLSGLEDPLEVWYSKSKLKGEGVAFSDSFLFRVDPKGGDVSAVKIMDDKILIFKQSLIFFVAGDGPNDTGAQNNYSIPQLITSDVGCPYPNSLVLMPLGVMFKSNKGIYLIDRSLQVRYIGAEVEAYNSQNVTSSDVVENQNQVRFLTDSGVTLVYDYYFNQWSTFTNFEGLDADIWNGLYVRIQSNGQLIKESYDSFQDGNIEYRLRLATAWLKMAGVQGYQRVRRAAVLGDYKSSHILRMKVGYDYESTYSDSVLFNAGSVIDQNYYGQDSYFGESAVYGGVSDNVYQFRAHLRRQKCESIRFLFEDITAGNPGESYSLSDLSLEVGVKRGIVKLRSQKTVG